MWGGCPRPPAVPAGRKVHGSWHGRGGYGDEGGGDDAVVRCSGCCGVVSVWMEIDNNGVVLGDDDGQLGVGDREMGSIFDFGRNARRKIIPVAGGGGSGGGRWWPEMMREMEREI
ncbi:hypothetical protein Tco_0782120 [Tanacetum coccineum]